MKQPLHVIISSFVVVPVLLLSYQIGTPRSLSQAKITEYFREPAIKHSSEETKEIKRNIPQRVLEVPDLELGAATALAWDFKEDFYLYAKNTETTRPIASLTKLVMSAIVLDYAQPQELATVSLKAVRNDGNSGGLREGEILTVNDLLAASLLESSNDAAYSLAEYVGGKLTTNPEAKTVPAREFVRLMNQKFNDLNLVHTNFNDPNGLEDINSFSTAADLSKFIKYLRTNSGYSTLWDMLKLKSYHAEAKNGVATHDFNTTNPFVGEPNILGGKTGFTPRALGNMALVVSGPNNAEFIYLVLGSYDREGDMRKLIDWVNQAWVWPQ
ncbi:MAG: serine hydrolase [Patescibacteria group bacterium]